MQKASETKARCNLIQIGKLVAHEINKWKRIDSFFLLPFFSHIGQIACLFQTLSINELKDLDVYAYINDTKIL